MRYLVTIGYNLNFATSSHLYMNFDLSYNSLFLNYFVINFRHPVELLQYYCYINRSILIWIVQILPTDNVRRVLYCKNNNQSSSENNDSLHELPIVTEDSKGKAGTARVRSLPSINYFSSKKSVFQIIEQSENFVDQERF